MHTVDISDSQGLTTFQLMILRLHPKVPQVLPAMLLYRDI
jgi:hypothetical protein